MNSDHKRIAIKILVEQTKSNNKNTLISKVQQIAQEIGVKLKNEQIQMEKAGKRKYRKINRRKNKTGNDK